MSKQSIFDEHMLAQVKEGSDAEHHLLNMTYNDDAPSRMKTWLLNERLSEKIRVGVVVYRNIAGELIARSKAVVITDGGNCITGYFYHEEPYGEFPSDHFKTKILLVTGGA